MSLSTDLFWLTLTAAASALLWLPMAIRRFVVLGPRLVMTGAETPDSPWEARVRTANAGAVAGLAVFAALVLAAHATGAVSPLVGPHAQGYFWAHLGLFAATLWGVRPVRCLFTLAAAGAQLAIAWTILAGA